MLGRLVGDDDLVAFGELAGPHAGAVDDEVALDVAGVGPHPGDLVDEAAGACADRLDAHALDDVHAPGPGAAGQAHREVDGVDPSVAGHVEPREQVVGPREGEQLGHLTGADLLDLQPEVALEGGHAAVLLEAVGIGCGLDEADGPEAGRDAGLRLQRGIQVAGVQAKPGARLARAPETRHEAGCVPGRAGRQAVPLDDEDVGDPEVRQVVGDGGADDPAPDDDDPGSVGQ